MDDLSHYVPLVCVIIVNWNGRKHLSRCLSSLMAQTYSNFKVLLVDNTSTDGSVRYVQSKFPSVEILQNNDNWGFAIANNIGILHCLRKNAQFLFLLNNDTMIDDENLISKLVDTAQKGKDIGIVGPKVLLLRNRKIIQDIGITCDIMGFPAGLHSGELDSDEHKGCREVFGVSGCAMLIKTNILQKVGYFDPDFFMFMEDIDLCWRTRLAGFKIIANADALIYHEGGGTAPGGPIKGSSYQTSIARSYLRERNTIRTILKNYSGCTLTWILPFYLLFEVIELALFFAFLKLHMSSVYAKALFWNLRNLRRTFIHRNSVQRTRRVKDGALMKMMLKGSGKLKFLKLLGIPEFVKG